MFTTPEKCIKKLPSRVFLIVADSLGVGAAPDASEYFNDGLDDTGANTLLHAKMATAKSFVNLRRLGLYNIGGVNAEPPTPFPIAAYGKMAEASHGKDTITGHREITGTVSEREWPTYKNGFPKEIIDKFSKAVGRGVLCNLPYSGTEAILDYGRKHIETGDLIVYTSGDSVFQIAAHEDTVPPDLLLEYCRLAREILVGEHAVARVIARPFIGEYPNFTRTSNRRDLAFVPRETTLLDRIAQAGQTVIGIGKIGDIFAGKSVAEDLHTVSNQDGIEKTVSKMKSDFRGLCFINLVDFDSSYGHRRDPRGYAEAIVEFDLQIPRLINAMREDDVLIITADHGCDPSYPGTDHTREYVPVLIAGKNISPVNLGVGDSFAELGELIAVMLGV